MRVFRRIWSSAAVPIAVRRLLRSLAFRGSSDYWDRRYRAGGTSGSGSYGRLAAFKAEFVNNFISKNEVESVVEFGCGDGNQLALAQYPKYIGLDVARAAIDTCMTKFASDLTKSFFLYDPRRYRDSAGVFSSDLSLSLDVIFHLVEDNVFELYMGHLFGAAERFVIVYSSDVDLHTDRPHERHREFTNWVTRHQPEWRLIAHQTNDFPYAVAPDGSMSEFFVYGRS